MYPIGRINFKKTRRRDLTRFNQIVIQARAQMAADTELLAYRESTCTNLSASCPYEIIV